MPLIIPPAERRDYFVRAALQGLCAQAGLPGSPDHQNAKTVAEDIGKWALLIADATLHEIYIHPLSHPPRVLHISGCATEINLACNCGEEQRPSPLPHMAGCPTEEGRVSCTCR